MRTQATGVTPGAQVREGRPDIRSLRSWSRNNLRSSLGKHGALLAVLLFLAYSVEYLNVHLDRLFPMFGRIGSQLANRYYPPDIEYIMDDRYLGYVFETIQMGFLGALFGILIAAPLAWFASANMTPNRRFLYPFAKVCIMWARSVHEMIWAIVFVTILGFGTLPGILALVLYCIGFAGKLFSEEIEAIDPGPVEAVRSTGASGLAVMLYGVLPQIRVACTGITIYTWDVAFRAATVVGFFGAGGMGWYLRRNVQQLETERVAAILLSIIVLICIAEVLSAWIRGRVAKSGSGRATIIKAFS